MSPFGKPNIKGLLKRRKIDKLLELVEHDYVAVRKEAVDALAQLGDTQATGVLLKRLMKEHTKEIEDSIAAALAKIDDPALIPNVQALLLMMKKKEAHKFQMENLIKVLDASRDKSAAVPLIFLLDDMAYINSRAAEALVKKGAAGIPLLRSFLNSEGEPFFGGEEKNGSSGVQGPKITYNLNEKIINVLKKLGWSPDNENEELLELYYQGYWEELAGKGKEGHKLIRKRAKSDPYIRKYLQETELKSGNMAKLKKWLKDKDFGLAGKAFKELEQMGTDDSKKLLFDTSLQWLRKTADFGFCQYALEYLNKLGTSPVRQPIAEFLFRDRPQYGGGGKRTGQGAKRSDFLYSEDYIYPEYLEKYTPLFHDYTSYILKLAGYKAYCAGYQFYYPMEEQIDCVQELCKITSPISTNILWLTKGLGTIEVIDQASEFGRVSKQKLDFEPVKKIARKELEKRGNPEYQPDAYLEDRVWKIIR